MKKKKVLRNILCVPQNKESPTDNDMRLSKYWQNFYFCVNYPLNIPLNLFYRSTMRENSLIKERLK